MLPLVSLDKSVGLQTCIVKSHVLAKFRNFILLSQPGKACYSGQEGHKSCMQHIYIYYMNDVECVRIYSVQLKQCLLSYQMPTPTALDESGITLSRWEQC